MALSPVRPVRPTLADAAYQSIVDAVMSGDIGPGYRLIMDQLAQELDISRTPVRDALHRLEREGLIEPTGRRGYVVRVVDDNEVEQIYTAREAIEGYAARLLVESFDPSDLVARFSVSLERAAHKQDGTSAGSFAANRAVHRSVVELTDNRFLLTSFDGLWGLGLAVFAFIQRFPVDAESDDVVGDHQGLVAAFASGDADAAQAAMIMHIRDGFGRYQTTG